VNRLRSPARAVGAAVAVIAGLTLVGLGVGWLAGDRAGRGVAIALYIVGGVIAIAGVAGGFRGRLRPTRQGRLLPTGIRRASDDEITDAMVSSAMLVGLGFLILLAAVIVDPGARIW
jgi:hypothetical protein